MATEDKRIDQLPAVTSLDLTSLMALQQSGNAKKVTLQQLLDYLNGLMDTGNAVLFVAQTLTDEQKLQARTNIGAAAPGEGDGGGSAANAVLYVAQTLTEEQQHQARQNIRCGSVGEVADNCVALGKYSHAEGYQTRASGSRSHAEGRYALATSENSHAEGSNTIASGATSHAEGENAKATGYCSHAEGISTTASGSYSHAEGYYTKATRRTQHVQGKYNIEDTKGVDGTAKGKYAHIVGNGTADDARSNAHTLDWSGVPWFAGDRVMLGGTGMDDENAVALMPIFIEQTLTDEQKLQARTNIGAQQTMVVENLSSQVALNYPENTTSQLINCFRYGKICMFTVQINITTAITEQPFGFAVVTLPVAAAHRVWINNGTQFYMNAGSGAIRVNNYSLAAGNYLMTGFFFINE